MAVGRRLRLDSDGAARDPDSRRRSRLLHAAVAVVATCALALAGCSSEDAGTEPGGPGGTGGGGGDSSGGTAGADNGFVSDAPNGQYGGPAGDGAESASGTGAGGGGDRGGENSDDEAEKAITEADIIQVHEGRLYALSQYGGLSIIDVSKKDSLKLLGRYQTQGLPFEMYLRDGIVYAMFSDWGQYVEEADGVWSWVQSSRIEALDVTKPSSIAKIGSYDLPGAVSDSRIVGDVLYVVSYQDGYCWQCQKKPNTTVTSLAVGDPSSIGVIDTLTFTADDPYGYGWWRRSISVTQDRMYVAGIEWDGEDEGHSTIQVVDISDPSGILVLGDSVEAAGQIESRWQMDEKDGVLRVISQPGVWSNGSPIVQTFSVVSSEELTPLASLELVLPKPERLRSVRFDGPRAYAITAEQTDPLFTIDLSDPAEPKQLGELEMPGWIYHMEPRGDRLFALGFDPADKGGSLNVSLFDVSDMTQPKMLVRVPFGGEWSSLAEDQDRIHKAFKFVDELGLILVPFGAYTYDEGGAGDEWGGCVSFDSGVQLFDFTNDTIKKRGVADIRGFARRAFVHDGRLFAVSDAEVSTFDFADRDAPKATATLALSVDVTRTVVLGDKVARLAADWWTNEARIEIVPRSNPTIAEPLGALSLDDEEGGGCHGWSYYDTRAFGHGQYLYVVRAGYEGKSLVDVIDVSNALAPAKVTQVEVPAGESWGWLGGVISTGEPIVQIGSTLAFRNIVDEDWDSTTVQKATLEVLDLSSPAKPVLSSLPLPEGLGHTYLVAQGSDVLLSHWAPVPGDPGKVKFYVDRVDLSSPKAPKLEASINVPGSLVSADSKSGRILTIDYKRTVLPDVTWQQCYDAFGWDATFESDDPEYVIGDCIGMKRTFKLVDVEGVKASLTATSPIDDSKYLSGLQVGDDRVFAATADYDAVGGGTYGVLVVGGMSQGKIQQVFYPMDEHVYAYPVAAAGKRLVTAAYSPASIGVLDATELGDLGYETKGVLPSYLYSVTLNDGDALCSMGDWGISVVPID